MIICPECKKELITDGNGYYCNVCSYKARNISGIIYFHSDLQDRFNDYAMSSIDALFKVEEKHFWFINRKKVINKLFEKYVKTNQKVIEIGAGTGNVACMLKSNGYNIAVGEMYGKGLDYAGIYGIDERYQFDLTEAPFKDHFNVVGMFDVLEHMQDEDLALKNIYQMLKQNGIVVVTVPAHMWLWNREDAIAFHKRRYNLSKIKNVFSRNGFEIIYAKHFFVLILPFLCLRAILKRDKGAPPEEIELYRDIKINLFVNFLMDTITKFENVVFKNMRSKIGGSIALVARKL